MMTESELENVRYEAVRDYIESTKQIEAARFAFMRDRMDSMIRFMERLCEQVGELQRELKPQVRPMNGRRDSRPDDFPAEIFYSPLVKDSIRDFVAKGCFCDECEKYRAYNGIPSARPNMNPPPSVVVTVEGSKPWRPLMGGTASPTVGETPAASKAMYDAADAAVNRLNEQQSEGDELLAFFKGK